MIMIKAILFFIGVIAVVVILNYDDLEIIVRDWLRK